MRPTIRLKGTPCLPSDADQGGLEQTGSVGQERASVRTHGFARPLWRSFPSGRKRGRYAC
jgi:hypothetical protein